MKKSWLLALMCICAVVPAAAQDAASPSVATVVVATKGQMLHAADGGRLAPVYRVTDNGSVQIIIYGKVVTVPASTLSVVDGELTTSLTKNQVIALP